MAATVCYESEINRERPPLCNADLGLAMAPEELSHSTTVGSLRVLRYIGSIPMKTACCAIETRSKMSPHISFRLIDHSGSQDLQGP